MKEETLVETVAQPVFPNLIHSGKIALLLSYCILLGGLYALAATTRMVILAYTALPYWDHWSFIAVVASLTKSSSTLAYLWRQHNEHRILFPKLFELADLYLFGGRNVFLLTSIFLLQIVHLAVFAKFVRGIKGVSRSAWLALCGFACFCLFYPIQWENFVQSFQIAFVLLALAADASILALALYRDEPQRKKRRVYFTVCLVSALIATLSLANGLLIWPILVVGAYTLRVPRRASLLLLGTAALITAFYLHGYASPPPNTHPLAAITRPVSLLQYVATYLSSPWRVLSLSLGKVLAAISILCVILMSGRFLGSSAKPSAAEVSVLLVLSFYVGSAMITAFGRTILGVGQALSSRYQSFALLYWCYFVVFVICFLIQKRQNVPLMLLLQTVLLAVVVLNDMHAKEWTDQGIYHGRFVNPASAALATGVRDDDLLQRIFPSSEEVLAVSPFLRQHELSIFSDAYFRSVGRNIGSVYKLAAPVQCMGSFDSAQLVGSGSSQGYRVSGWAWDKQKKRGALRILFATQEGTIVGFATGREFRPGLAGVVPEVHSPFSGWVGDIRRPTHQMKVVGYAVIEDNSAICPIHNAQELN
jgi:hypothetical protein